MIIDFNTPRRFKIARLHMLIVFLVAIHYNSYYNLMCPLGQFEFQGRVFS